MLFSSAISAVKGSIKRGGNVIFDSVITTQQRADQITHSFKEFSPIYLGLSCSWVEIEKRTIERQDRTIAEAKYSFEHSPKFFDYNEKIDSTNVEPTQLAKNVLDLLH